MDQILGAGQGPALFWAKPLSDPLGGTKHSGGRYAVRMSEPLADESKESLYLVLIFCQSSFGI